MRHFIAFAAGLGLVCSAADSSSKEQQPKSFAGWMGLFPTLGGYQLTFQPASVEGDKDNPIYRQTAHYDWTGGADRHYAVTVARNAKFKETYSVDEVKKGQPQPYKVKVGKHTGWLWTIAPTDKKETQPIRARLVILLADDRIVMIEQKGLGPFEDLETVAQKFDAAGIKEALDNPPDTGSRRVVEAFSHLKKGMSYTEVANWVGYADKDIGSGIHIMAYTLDDGSQVLLGFPDFNKLLYVKHQGKNGAVTDLAK